MARTHLLSSRGVTDGTTDVAIIGAGPYGLSVAAHLRTQRIRFRIFGRPMESWISHMPKGMFLKSDGFASDLSDPDRKLTLKKFCAEQNISYADMGSPVSLETFCNYGLAFQQRMVPELEEKTVISLERIKGAFKLKLKDGQTVTAQRVVMAIGLGAFRTIPQGLTNLPAGVLTHSSDHHDLSHFKDKRVVVFGGGSAAIDIAYLLKDQGADVHMIIRDLSLKFHARPEQGRKSLWGRMTNPTSGLGSGWRSRLCTDAPLLFRFLPAGMRLKIVRRHLGPSGGWFTKDKVVGKIPVETGCTLVRCHEQAGTAHLVVCGGDGIEREIVADHVIAATGYKVDIHRLGFLSPDIRSRLKTVDANPVLSMNFECSIPGLYFVGVTAASSFGPMMRFAFGAAYAAKRLSHALVKRSVGTQTRRLAPQIALSPGST